MTKICGRQPLRGDGTVWCVRKQHHKGLHVSDENWSFRRVEPNERVDGTYDAALDPSTTDPVCTCAALGDEHARSCPRYVEKRKSSRRLTPQVGKAGALPEQGRRLGRDRRAGRVIDTIKGDRATMATLDMLRSAQNRLQWYVRRGGKRVDGKWKAPQSTIDGLALASALAAFVAGDPAQAPIDGLLLLRDVLARIPKRVELVQRTPLLEEKSPFASRRPRDVGK